jgi:hypothetical protein
MLWPKSYEVVGHCRRLLNEELSDLYSSPNIFRVIKSNEMGGACRTLRGEQRCILALRRLARKPEEDRPLRRPRFRWEDNIKMDLSRIRIGAVIALISFRIGTVGARVPQNAGNFLSS